MKTLPKCLIIFQFIFLVSIRLLAQDTTPQYTLIPSGDLIKQGVELYDSSKYLEAAAVFSQVNRNDTAYADALYELALTREALKQYDSSLRLAYEGLTLPGEKSNHYILIGNIYDKQGKTDSALKIYERAIAIYPYNYLIYFNKGVTYLKNDKFLEAEKAFIASSTLNPYHITSLYNLGLTNESMGRITEALLCYYMCGIENPNYMRNLEELEDYLNSKSGIESKPEDYPCKPGEKCRNFDEIATYIKSNIVLNSKYKTKVDINNIVIKQGQLLLENIKYDKSVKSYYMQFPARFFATMAAEEYTETLLYHLFSGVDKESIQKKVSKEEKSIKKMTTRAVELINEIRSTHAIDPETVKSPVVYEYNGNNMNFFGAYTDNTRKVKTGEWVSVLKNGAIEAKLNFVDNKRQGAVTIYNNECNIVKTLKFVDDIDDGPVANYHDNGTKNQEYTTYSGKAGGKYAEYYSGGQLYQEGQLANEVFEGIFKGFYPNGAVRFTKNYINGKENGNSKLYYLNGKLQYDINYLDDALDGDYVEYFENGNIQNKGKYLHGKMVGKWEIYFSNGKLSGNVNYDDKGKLAGKTMNYRTSGSLDNMFVMDDNGKGNGQRLFFDKDTTLIAKYFLKGMELEKYEYYDKKGKVLSTAEQSKGSIALNSVYYDNTPRSEGMEKFGEADGLWKYYNALGYLTSQKHFAKGQTDGDERFFHPDGSLKSLIHHKDDMLDGYYVSFQTNGKFNYLGWYKNDKKEGEWRTYYPDGSIRVKSWFLNNQLDGYQEFYLPNGKKNYEEIYNEGLLAGINSYDTSGVLYESCKLTNGNGKLITHYPGGKVKNEMAYLNGSIYDTLVQYFVNGKVRIRSLYIGGKIQGPYREYYPSGKILRENQDVLGKAEGKIISWEEDGLKSYEADYLDDNCNGTARWYNDDGLETTAVFEDDDRDGPSTYYARDGSLICVLNYVEDAVKSVSYQLPGGKLSEPIPVTKGECTVKTYFQNAKISAEISFLNGYRNGNRVFYYPSGKVLEKATYVNSEIHGILVNFYENGSKSEEAEYYYGDMHGAKKVWYKGGILKSDEHYFFGLLNGECKYYDRTGKLKTLRSYYYGKLLKEVIN